MPTVSVLVMDSNDLARWRAVSHARRGPGRYRTLTRVTLRLFDTASRAVREFQPMTPGRAGIYLCGPTAAGAPHLGQLRSAVCFDILVRWLETAGLRVSYCRNVTDVDDKILAEAAACGCPWWAAAERNQREFAAAYARLGCRPPDGEPRATGHIPDMLELVGRLLAGGQAYRAGDDVCFDVARAAGYGTLSGQCPDSLRPRERIDAAAKRDPRDFVLWKGARPGEPAWPSPWGPGRPGRHTECAAMAAGHLGPEFDIHGGGQDLIFPHHENERAQSRAAGDRFARYWVHHGLVTVGGLKMSAAAGNALGLAQALHEVRAPELRYYLGQAHYRSPLEYSPAALHDAAAAYQRIERFVARAGRAVDDDDRRAALPLSFSAALDDDLGVPAALAAVHATVRDGNYALSTGDLPATASCLTQVRAMLAVLGLDPLAPAWQAGDPGGRLSETVDALVVLALRQREAARARGDYASADSIRDSLEDTGVLVEDTPEGPRWELAR
jgi:cysteinyl-tRNA synthetase